MVGTPELSEVDAARVEAVNALRAFSDGGGRIGEVLNRLVAVDPFAVPGDDPCSDDSVIIGHLEAIDQAVYGLLSLVASMAGRARIAELFPDSFDEPGQGG